MTALTFYGGVNEIGGNKILLEDKDTKVFLDFGKGFSRRAKFFEEFINPRVANGIVDFLHMGLLPDIEGVYRDDLMKMAGRKIVKPNVDAVLLTHAHSDHADYISFLHEDIPIYMGETCHLILKALEERSNRDIEKAKEVKPVALLAEGTRIKDEEKQESEENVYKDSDKIVSSTDRLVLVDFNFKDVDRLRTFYNIAKENERKFVVKLSDAYFLKWLSKDPKLNVPDVDDESIVIYMPKKGSGTYSDSDYKGKEEQCVGRNNAWTAEQIAVKESKVLCAIGFFSFTALIDIRPDPGAVYIHSASEPYNEEQVIDKKRIDNWIDHFGMNKFQSHCSGHARGRDLIEAVTEINAKMLFPIHTEYPDAYNGTVSKLTIVEEGKR